MPKFILSLAYSIICLGLINPVLAEPAEQAPWWLKPQRMLQTNLREIDATMDLDKYVHDVKDYYADVVLFNIGGIVANYPTELQYHYRNPNMKGDLVGTVIKRLHKEGVRVIGRFDFSKINEKFAAQKPEWLYVSEKGKNVNYNGQVHTCVSGGYQQEYMFKILGEAVDRYPLDGVFFNMIGYQKSDYSGNYHGLCQCQACKDKFRKLSGMELPPKRDDSNPAYKKSPVETGCLQKNLTGSLSLSQSLSQSSGSSSSRREARTVRPADGHSRRILLAISLIGRTHPRYLAPPLVVKRSVKKERESEPYRSQ